MNNHNNWYVSKISILTAIPWKELGLGLGLEWKSLPGICGAPPVTATRLWQGGRERHCLKRRTRVQVQIDLIRK